MNDSLQAASLADKSVELLVDELLECCKSDGLSKECIREIIERHKLTPHHNNQVSSYQFFRMACYNANAKKGIIQYLLEYFPAAASTADGEGQLPLHHACLRRVTRCNSTPH